MDLIRVLLLVVMWGYALALMLYVFLRIVIGDGFWLLAWFNNFSPYYFLPLVAVLPLALWLRAEVLSILSLVLLAIGAGWFLPRLIPNNLLTSYAHAGQTLKVVTFNVWGANEQLNDVIEWLRETDADLILLQEIPPEWAGKGIPELEAIYPYQMAQPLKVRASGNAILSRYPIIHHERHDLHNGFKANDRFELDVNGLTVAVYNIHFYMPQDDNPRFTPPLDNPFLNMVAKYDDRRRNMQIDRLLTLLESEQYPVIVAGDFNMSDNAVIYGQITRRLNDSYREAGFGLGATWPIAEIAGFPRIIPPLLRIDYIWHSDQFSALNAAVGSELGSDHLPLVTTLAILKEG